MINSTKWMGCRLRSVKHSDEWGSVDKSRFSEQTLTHIHIYLWQAITFNKAEIGMLCFGLDTVMGLR